VLNVVKGPVHFNIAAMVDNALQMLRQTTGVLVHISLPLKQTMGLLHSVSNQRHKHRWGQHGVVAFACGRIGGLYYPGANSSPHLRPLPLVEAR
jgi:hypothetical protein